MGIVEKLTFGLGAKLEGNVLDTKKEDKKVSKKSSKTILPKVQHQLVFGFEKRNGKPVTTVGKFQIEDERIKEILKLWKIYFQILMLYLLKVKILYTTLIMVL